MKRGGGHFCLASITSVSGDLAMIQDTECIMQRSDDSIIARNTKQESLNYSVLPTPEKALIYQSDCFPSKFWKLKPSILQSDWLLRRSHVRIERPYLFRTEVRLRPAGASLHLATRTG